MNDDIALAAGRRRVARRTDGPANMWFVRPKTLSMPKLRYAATRFARVRARSDKRARCSRNTPLTPTAQVANAANTQVEYTGWTRAPRVYTCAPRAYTSARTAAANSLGASAGRL